MKGHGTMRVAWLAMAVAALSGCGRELPPVVTAEDVYVRLPAVPGNPAAAYLTLHGGPSADRLVAIESPAASRIELHASMAEGAGMTMRPLSGLDVPAGGTVSLAPGGNHAMLFNPDARVKPGAPFPLTLRFRSGEIARVSGRTIAAGDEAP